MSNESQAQSSVEPSARGTVAPRQSYIIWFSQRVGSTLLAQALEDTGIAGRPHEWLNAPSAATVLEKNKVATALELRGVLWRDAQTPNGVLGIKYGMVPKLHEDLTALFGAVVPQDPDPDGYRAWKAFFPNCRHVFLTRRSKIRIAVSWWRAIKSEEWHRPNRSEPPTAVGAISRKTAPVDFVDQYDSNAIEHLVAEANLREAAIAEQFVRWGVVHQTIVYEDFIASYEPTVRAVLEFLQIPDRHEITVPMPAFDRLADEVSEAWFQRFIRERGTKVG